MTWSRTDAASSPYPTNTKNQSVAGFQAGPGTDFRPTNFRRDCDHGRGDAYRARRALDHKLIVGATLTGYDATPENTTKLVAVARMQGAAAKRAVGPVVAAN